jgi:hypothetical protein
VIVAANLSFGEEEKLLRVLREHRITLGWTIVDIKGISPAKCMHQIFLEDEVNKANPGCTKKVQPTNEGGSQS